ncbi:phage Gp37Gp68 family protein (plasmid) [Calothrix sp. PCC 7716]|nr:phage Gp37Gp68 family protein [Calothrix sp. PCC 7716]
MATKISWCDETWNAVVGCSRVSPGCANCYAAKEAASSKLQQFEQYPVVSKWDGTVKYVESQLLKPFKWRQPKRIFPCSMSDLFHSNVLDDWRDNIFAVMAANPHHTFLVLTKRPENAVKYFSYPNRARWITHRACDLFRDENKLRLKYGLNEINIKIPLPNVIIGATVENQDMADKRIPLLLQIPAKLRWLSIEPLLGPVDLKLDGISWVVCGGESGAGYRMMDLTWLESIANQCDKAGVPLFVKQDSHFHSGKQGRINNELWSKKQFPVIAENQ